jgi:erythromycin esterase-like protein/predicted phosphoribosyltransferase
MERHERNDGDVMTRAADLRRGAPRQVFRNRREAGKVLADLLQAYRDRDDVVVLGLARGGIPVAWEVAAALRAPLDAFVVRKLGAPGHEEFAVGALASGGRVVINDDVVRGLGITPQQLRDIAESEGRELIRREAAYRGRRPPAEVAGKTVIVVDDGLATGASMLAAVQALREAEPAQIVIAVPAAPESTCREFAGIVDDVVCATIPTPFLAVGESFWDFSQVSDDEVRELLATPTTGAAVSVVRSEITAAEVIRSAAVEAPAGVPAPDTLEKLIGDARIVLIGESSHGTHEFYEARAAITKWLIEQKGFCAVAAEADWPDAYQVNRYVRGLGEDTNADEALSGFERFPAWMWRNVVVRDFAEWLRQHNQRCRSAGRRESGFYGLDLYSLHRSMNEVIAYLDKVDPAAAARARQRYACFDHTSADDGQAYGFAAAFGAGPSCEQQAIGQLVEFQRNALAYARRDGLLAEDEAFYAQQNARTVRDAELYYRAMFSGRVTSWNLRDAHMAQTLEALLAHLDRVPQTKPARIVVWAHNSHVGDARATEMGADGQLTLGQLVREHYPDESRLIGFTTYTGTVTAASEWGGIAERKAVRPALNGSVEELLHDTAGQAFLVSTVISPEAAEPLAAVRLGRAIGVIYQPATERQSHYFHTRPADQFDAIIHIDQTRALEPLEPASQWIAGETPETYPSGL